MRSVSVVIIQLILTKLIENDFQFIKCELDKNLNLNSTIIYSIYYLINFCQNLNFRTFRNNKNLDNI